MRSLVNTQGEERSIKQEDVESGENVPRLPINEDIGTSGNGTAREKAQESEHTGNIKGVTIGPYAPSCGERSRREKDKNSKRYPGTQTGTIRYTSTRGESDSPELPKFCGFLPTTSTKVLYHLYQLLLARDQATVCRAPRQPPQPSCNYCTGSITSHPVTP